MVVSCDAKSVATTIQHYHKQEEENTEQLSAIVGCNSGINDSAKNKKRRRR